MTINIGQLEEFKHNRVWKEIVKVLESWLTEIHMELEDPEMVLSDKILHRLGGNAQSIRRFIDILDLMIINIEGEERENV